MIFRTLMFLALSLLMGTHIAPAAAQFDTWENQVSAFRQKMVVIPTPNVVPTVVEVPFSNQQVSRDQFMVIENETRKNIASYLKEQYTMAPSPISVHIGNSRGYTGYPEYLVDTNSQSGVQFELPAEQSGNVSLRLSSPEMVVSSGMVFDLERNVSLPTSIEIRVGDGMGGERIVLAKSPMQSEYVNFLPTNASVWIINLTHAQPLKINELKLIQDNPERSVTRGLRFLAQPAMSYTVYFDPDRTVSLPYTESGNLVTDIGVVYTTSVTETNSQYVMADIDGDGAWDTIDNCVSVSNPEQTDIDQNGLGDDCEDFDRDGVSNPRDNCKDIPNANQYDEDYDGIGDICDKEESRFTERLPWVPWVGMGIAGAVLVGLFAIVGMRPMKPQSEEGSKDES